jgi:hypothetical protein
LWKNKECGFLGEELGNTVVSNFRTIDSVKGGMQFHMTNNSIENVTATNCTIVGFSQVNPPANIDSEYNQARGLIAPRTDGFKASNVKFYNFGSTMTPLQSCSDCYQFNLWVIGSKTSWFEQISYTNVTGDYIFWENWRTEVFIDLDGTLTSPLAL